MVILNTVILSAIAIYLIDQSAVVEHVMPFQKKTLLYIPDALEAGQIPNLWEGLLRCAIIVGLFDIFYVSLSGLVFQPLIHAANASLWSRTIMRPSVLWGIMGCLLMSFRTFLWVRYRPFLSARVNDAPSLTVIIPAYNEGHMVEKSIDSVAAAAYLHDRLEIVVVDDGSRDDTWQYIQRASSRYPGLVKPIRFSENKGKREALAAGFRWARGEIVVTIDSDSVIEADALLAIVGPFRDPSVGAVAGKVVVYNRLEGFIPRMLHVRYILSFDFLRAVQSTYGTVYCCPGALSAYRSIIVHEVLDSWIRQTFLGTPCTYGEDRSMTNFILSCGYNTVYQQSAIVQTTAPLTYARMCKMFLRWDRSYVKEEIRFAWIVWKRPLLSRMIALVDTVITNLRYPVSFAVWGMLLTMFINDPIIILRLLFAIGVMSMLNILYYLRSERSWDFIYGIFYSYISFFTLFWVFPYALLTIRSRSWMTR
jgi:hyaluronan synthase